MDVFQVIFHPYDPTLYPTVPPDDAGGTDPPDVAITTPAEQALTKTTTPESATPTAIGSGNQFSNCTQPMEGQGENQELYVDHNSDVTSTASSGVNSDDSDYL